MELATCSTRESVAALLQALDDFDPLVRQAAAVPLLSESLVRHGDPDTGSLFLAEAAAEALGRIGTREAEEALLGRPG